MDGVLLKLYFVKNYVQEVGVYDGTISKTNVYIITINYKKIKNK